MTDHKRSLWSFLYGSGTRPRRRVFGMTDGKDPTCLGYSSTRPVQDANGSEEVVEEDFLGCYACGCAGCREPGGMCQGCKAMVCAEHMYCRTCQEDVAWDEKVKRIAKAVAGIFFSSKKKPEDKQNEK